MPYSEFKTKLGMFLLTMAVLFVTEWITNSWLALLVMAFVMGTISLSVKSGVRKANGKPAFKSSTDRSASLWAVVLSSVLFASGLTYWTWLQAGHGAPLYAPAAVYGGFTFAALNIVDAGLYLFIYLLFYVLFIIVLARLLALLTRKKDKTGGSPLTSKSQKNGV